MTKHTPVAAEPNLRRLFSEQQFRPLGIRYALIFWGRVGSRNESSSRFFSTIALVVIFSGWYVTSSALPSFSARSSALLLALGVGLMIDLPRRVWARLDSAAESLDELFSASSFPSHVDFCRSVRGFLSTRRTVLTAVLGAFLVVLLYIIWNDEGSVNKLPGAVFFAFAGFWLGHSVYLISITARLCQIIGNAEALVLSPLSPIATAGLVGASRAMRTMASLGLWLLLVLSGSLVLRYIDNPTEDSLVLTVAFAALGFAGVTLIGLQSQVWLAGPANEAKELQMKALAPEISKLYEIAAASQYLAPETTRLSEVAQLQRHLEDTPESYNNHSILSAYIATAFGIVLQLVLAALAGRS